MKGGGGKKEQIVGVESSVTWRRVVIATTGPSPAGALPPTPSRSPVYTHPRFNARLCRSCPPLGEGAARGRVAAHRAKRSCPAAAVLM